MNYLRSKVISKDLVVLELDRYEAKKLADYLLGVDMHLSVGDRLFLARKLYNLLGEKQ